MNIVNVEIAFSVRAKRNGGIRLGEEANAGIGEGTDTETDP
jgi:hypothetical protein